MIDLKKEKIKKNVFLTISIISAFMFVAGLMCTIFGDNSPVKFIINESPIKLIVPPTIVFLVSYALYRKSKNILKENNRNSKN